MFFAFISGYPRTFESMDAYGETQEIHLPDQNRISTLPRHTLQESWDSQD